MTKFPSYSYLKKGEHLTELKEIYAFIDVFHYGNFNQRQLTQFIHNLARLKPCKLKDIVIRIAKAQQKQIYSFGSQWIDIDTVVKNAEEQAAKQAKQAEQRKKRRQQFYQNWPFLKKLKECFDSVFKLFGLGKDQYIQLVQCERDMQNSSNSEDGQLQFQQANNQQSTCSKTE